MKGKEKKKRDAKHEESEWKKKNDTYEYIAVHFFGLDPSSGILKYLT